MGSVTQFWVFWEKCIMLELYRLLILYPPEGDWLDEGFHAFWYYYWPVDVDYLDPGWRVSGPSGWKFWIQVLPSSDPCCILALSLAKGMVRIEGGSKMENRIFHGFSPGLMPGIKYHCTTFRMWILVLESGLEWYDKIFHPCNNDPFVYVTQETHIQPNW